MGLNTKLSKILRKIKFIKDWRAGKNFNINASFPAGHYYSPIANLENIKKREIQIWNKKLKTPGIDLNSKAQLELLKKIEHFYPELPFTFEKQDHLRYNFANNYYSYTDGIILYSLLRHFKPQRIIEIGSGYSSAVMLDTSELFLNYSIHFTFIEPLPGRLMNLLSKKENSTTTIIEKEVQIVPLEIFQTLESNDILFIDSSHVIKTGSDVNFLIFEVLPLLKPGVMIHFHDIYYPFEYPREWVYKGLNWNETYTLRAFLMYNSDFEIILFSDYLHNFYPEAFKGMPLTYNATGSNIWLRKK